MKFSTVALLLLMFLPTNSVFAQLIKTYGFKIAATSAGQDFDYTDFSVNTKRRIGFNAAVFVEWLDLPFFSFVTQMEYAQRGMGMDVILTASTGPEEIGRITDDNRVDYLSIPLFVKLTVPMGIISPFLSLGPRLDVLLGHKSGFFGFGNVYDRFRKSNVGGTVSLGAELVNVLPITLTLEVRYNKDFRDSYSTPRLRVRNNSFDVWVGAGL